MPPIIWDRAVFALRMRPAAKTPSIRRTRTSALSRSTPTSAKCAPKPACAYVLSRLGADRSLGLLHPAGDPGLEFPTGSENCRTGGCGPKRAAGTGGGRKAGMAKMNGDTVDRQPHGLGRDLGQDRVRAKQCGGYVPAQPSYCWYLHDPDPDRGRDHGAAGRPCHRSSWRYPLSAHRRFRRLFWGRNLRCGSSRCLSETQGRGRLRDEGGRGIGRGPPAWTARTRTPASARISPKSGWIATRLRCVCDECSVFLRRPHPQCEDGAVPNDRRHDVGDRVSADGGEPRRLALRFIHGSGFGELPRRGERRCGRDGCRVSG